MEDTTVKSLFNVEGTKNTRSMSCFVKIRPQICHGTLQTQAMASCLLSHLTVPWSDVTEHSTSRVVL